MSGNLRVDLVKCFDKCKRNADLVLALGTSLAAVGADNIVEQVARRQRHMSKGAIGAVIISLQRTFYDDVSALRIFGKLDDVLGMLAEYMELTVQSADSIYHPDVPAHCRVPFSALPEYPLESSEALTGVSKPQTNVFRIPYDPVSGERIFDNRSTMHAPDMTDSAGTDAGTCVWDLRVSSRVQIMYGPAKGYIGTITDHTDQGHYLTRFPRIVADNDEWLIRRDKKRYPDEDPRGDRIYWLGSWWVESACKGLCDRIPFVSIQSGQLPIIPEVENKRRKT